jgi:hypothetical protein
MINADMRLYNFYTIGPETDAYGQEQISAQPQGQVKIAINVVSQSIGENINYKDSTYIGLTQDAKVDDTYIIEYGAIYLKVMYVIPKGRFKQVFMNDFGPVPEANNITVLDSGVI